MAVTAVDSVGTQNANLAGNNLVISPENANDTELSSLLSGSGNLKTSNRDTEKIGELMTSNGEQPAPVSDACLNSLPGLLGSIATSTITKNMAFAIAGLVVAGTTLLVSLIKNKKAVKA